MTAPQARALTELWPGRGIDIDGPLEFGDLFGREAEVVLEIGYGNGESLVEQAQSDPERDYLGIEVHEPGIGHCLIRAQELGLGNLRLLRRDAVDVLRDSVADGSLTRVNLYFPDPWPKKRHYKRRILQPDFLELVARRLVAGGTLHVATDWANYAEHIDDVVADCPQFDVAERREHSGDAPLDRPTTKFERRGLARGHRIVDWRLRRA